MTHFESYFKVSEKLFYCWVQDTTNNTITLFFYIETAMTTTALFWHGLKLSPLFSFPQRPLALITVKRKEQCSSNVSIGWGFCGIWYNQAPDKYCYQPRLKTLAKTLIIPDITQLNLITDHFIIHFKKPMKKNSIAWNTVNELWLLDIMHCMHKQHSILYYYMLSASK